MNLREDCMPYKKVKCKVQKLLFQGMYSTGLVCHSKYWPLLQSTGARRLAGKYHMRVWPSAHWIFQCFSAILSGYSLSGQHRWAMLNVLWFSQSKQATGVTVKTNKREQQDTDKRVLHIPGYEWSVFSIISSLSSMWSKLRWNQSFFFLQPLPLKYGVSTAKRGEKSLINSTPKQVGETLFFFLCT